MASPLVESRPATTVGAELDDATGALTRQGIEAPQTRALSTWSALAHSPPGGIWLDRAHAPPDGDFVQRFRGAIARQAAGEPFQYAVQLAGFRHLELFVDRRVLIPRSETEGLVDHVLEHGRGHGWGVAADVGTGSGAIALSLATEGSFERVVACDVSREALDVAGINLDAVAPATPVELQPGSLFVPLGNRLVDVIVSNPPYVSTGEWLRLQPLVRDFEPRLALDGGPDGLEPTRAILRGAARHLVPGGLLALEIDSTRGAPTLDAAHQCGWLNGRILPDATGRDRYFLATKGE